jgi:hypothetical protein
MSAGRPDALAMLLASAEASLRDKVIPASAGEARFAGLMAASAIGMAAREISLSRTLDKANADVAELAPQPSPFPDPLIALTHLIREGLMDGQEEAYLRLLRLAVTRTAVTRPKMLTSGERAMAGLNEALP